MIGFLLENEAAEAKATEPVAAAAQPTESTEWRTGRQTPGVELAQVFKPDPDQSLLDMLPRQSSRLTIEEVRGFVMSAVKSGASDITIQSDQQPRVEIHGRQYRGSRRPWSPSEVQDILGEFFGASNAITEINGRRVLDFSYELNQSDGGKQRFRVNATGIQSLDAQGVEITLRALPSTTPTIDEVSLDRTMISPLTPRDGIVVIAGATGAGKSTTMAAITRHHLENVSRPVKIVDIQAPIEFTFRDVTENLEGSSSLIGQSEVGRHIDSFAAGVHSGLRRAPDIINVGEARDFETIKTSLEASLTGHLVYTTTHAGSVVDAMRRLLSVFPAEERDARAYDLASALRVLVVQQLLPRIDRPGRVPVREYLEFTPAVQQQLYAEPVTRWPHVVTNIMREGVPGAMSRTFSDEVAPLVRDGIVSSADAFRASSDKRFLRDLS